MKDCKNAWLKMHAFYNLYMPLIFGKIFGYSNWQTQVEKNKQNALQCLET